jgi:hypothetical protein
VNTHTHTRTHARTRAHTHTHTHTHTVPCISCVDYSSQTDGPWRWPLCSPSEHMDSLTQWHSSITQNAWIYGSTAVRTWDLTQNEVSSYLRDWWLVPQKHLLLESIHIISHIGTPAKKKKKKILIFHSDSHQLSTNKVQITQLETIVFLMLCMSVWIFVLAIRCCIPTRGTWQPAG